jgi:hypothetical protein
VDDADLEKGLYRHVAQEGEVAAGQLMANEGMTIHGNVIVGCSEADGDVGGSHANSNVKGSGRSKAMSLMEG